MDGFEVSEVKYKSARMKIAHDALKLIRDAIARKCNSDIAKAVDVAD